MHDNITITDDMRRTISENPPALTEEQIAATPLQKWTPDPQDYPGKVQVNRFNKLWSRLRTQAREIAKDGLRSFLLFGGPEYGFEARKAASEIGAKHGWTISKKTANAICKEIDAAIDESGCARAIERLETDEEVIARLEGEERMRIRREEEKAAVAAMEEKAAAIFAKRPPAATALIVAEHDKDTSDPMSDYFAHTTTAQVAIGWRFGNREDFRQLRAAAATFEHTAHLGPDGEDKQNGYDIEHRDQWAGGGGNFVKAGGQDNTGWRVKSIPIAADGSGFGYGIFTFIEDELPEAPEPAEPGEAVEGEGYHIVEQYHEKKAIPIWTVVLHEKTSTDAYRRNNSAAKRLGGWYFRSFRGNEGGFHFPTQAAALEFAERHLEIA